MTLAPASVIPVTEGAPPLAERVVGRYALLGELASGGMATVHFGRLIGPVGFSRTVAIKRLHAQFAKDPEFVAMFLDEARLAARIQHPNVVATIDVVALEGELLLVLEYVHGESLAQLLRAARKARRPLPIKIVAALASGILHGLHAAHEARSEHGEPLGIVHRDMSPQNVLVGVDGTARVLDFGVAKASGRVITTREGQLKGKLAYMSPEQIKGQTVDRRTDIYAASIVIWEVLTGRRLFDGDNDGLLFSQVSQGARQPPGELVPGLPPEVDTILMRGLAVEPEARFATAWEMAVALEEAVGLASPRQVGEWVAEISGDRLEKRARRVTEIESISTLDFVPVSEPSRISQRSDSAILVAAPARSSLVSIVAAPPAAPAAPRAHPLDDPGTDVSSVGTQEPFMVPTSGPKPRWILAGVGLTFLMSGLVWWAQSGNPGTPAPLAAASQIASVAPPIAVPPPIVAPPPVAATAEPHPTASAALPRPVAAASTRPRPGPRPDAVPASGCNPPYTIDAAGMRKLKPQCL